jgi:hypothetical protein
MTMTTRSVNNPLQSFIKHQWNAQIKFSSTILEYVSKLSEACRFSLIFACRSVSSCEEAFGMPVKEVSPNLRARCMLLLCPLPPSLPPLTTIPLSLSYFEVPHHKTHL